MRLRIMAFAIFLGILGLVFIAAMQPPRPTADAVKAWQGQFK